MTNDAPNFDFDLPDTSTESAPPPIRRTDESAKSPPPVLGKATPAVGDGYKVFPGGRPMYETAQSTRDELEIASAVTHHLGLSRLWKLNPHSYGLDFAARYAALKPTEEIVGRANDEVYALIEAKARSRPYPSWLISALKAARAAEFAAAGLRVYFAWGVNLKTEWEVYLWQWSPKSLRTFVLAGRRDRNDPDDIEPMLVVPRDECVIFSALRSRVPLAARDSFSL